MLPSFATATPLGLELRLKVVPGASRSAVVGPLGERLKVRIAAPPEGGKANQAVCALLAAWAGVAEVRLIAGAGHAEKVVLLLGSRTLPTCP
jgi:uncharacterized protein (TIGR00251 family)